MHVAVEQGRAALTGAMIDTKAGVNLNLVNAALRHSRFERT
jgi:hypothetical protein